MFIRLLVVVLLLSAAAACADTDAALRLPTPDDYAAGELEHLAMMLAADGITLKSGVKVSGVKVTVGADPQCGAGTNGAALDNQNKCGVTGSSGSLSLSSPTNVSSCQTLSTADGEYRLTQNIGSDATAVCLELNGPRMKVDLNGYGVTGRVRATTAGDARGLELANGSITCDRTTAQAPACLEYTTESFGSFTNVTKFHHLTVTNTANCGASGASRALHIDYSPSGWTGTYLFEIYNNSIETQTCTDSVRTVAFNVTTNKPVKFEYNYVTFKTDSGAAQGLQLSGAAGCLVRNNRFRSLGANTTANLGRPWMIDSGSNNCIVEYNLVETYNLFSAVRDNTGTIVRHNRFLKVQNSGNRGAVWMADPDTGTYDLGGARVINNYFDVEDGTAVASRCAAGSGASNGFIVKDNTMACSGLGCSSGLLGRARDATGCSNTNIMQLCANTTAVNSQADAGAEIKLPSSGTGTCSGAGTCTTQACPI